MRALYFILCTCLLSGAASSRANGNATGSADELLKKRARSIILPTVKASTISVPQFAELMTELSKKSAAGKELSVSVAGHIKSKKATKAPTLTLDFSDISLLAVVNHACLVVGYHAEFTDAGIVLLPNGVTLSPLITRSYRLDPSHFGLDLETINTNAVTDDDFVEEDEGDQAGLTIEIGDNTGATQPTSQTLLVSCLKSLGIKFPLSINGTPSEAYYDRKGGIMTITNTHQNLTRFEHYLDLIDDGDPQVDLQVQLVELDVTEAELPSQPAHDLVNFIYTLPSAKCTIIGSVQARVMNGLKATAMHNGLLTWTTPSNYAQHQLSFTPQVSFNNQIVALNLNWSFTVWQSFDNYTRDRVRYEEDGVEMAPAWMFERRSEMNIGNGMVYCERLKPGRLPNKPLFLTIKPVVLKDTGKPVAHNATVPPTKGAE